MPRPWLARLVKAISYYTVSEESASSPCFKQLCSWKLCRPYLSDNISLDGEDQSTILTPPPRPLDAYNSLSEEDAWTKIGWTNAHIRHLIDVVHSWDSLSFSLLSYDHFLQSFFSNSSRFCSSTLMCAILALASRVVNEDHDDLKILPSGWVGSQTFCEKAEAKLQRGSSKRLPDYRQLEYFHSIICVVVKRLEPRSALKPLLLIFQSFARMSF